MNSNAHVNDWCSTPLLEHFSLPFDFAATKIEMLRADSTHFFLFDGCSTFFSDNSISGSIVQGFRNGKSSKQKGGTLCCFYLLVLSFSFLF